MARVTKRTRSHYCQFVVTWAEFLRHIGFSAAFMAVGLALIGFVRIKYGIGQQLMRQMLITALVMLGIIAVVSRLSTVVEKRCRYDPQEFCRTNDSVPLIFTMVLVFLVICIIRTRSHYWNR